MSEISVTELAEQTGLSVSHITHLIKRGILPEGRKDWKTRYLPKETVLAVLAHEENKQWEVVDKPARKRGPRKINPKLDWDSIK